jgi:hypothetical protein
MKNGPEAAVYSVALVVYTKPVEDHLLVLWIGMRYTNLESDILVSVKL